MRIWIQRDPARVLVVATAIVAAYVASGSIGLALAVTPGVATAVWAPTGIAIASLLVFGNRLWSAIFLGSLAVNAGAGASPGVALVISVGNTAEALLAVFLVRRFAGGMKAFESPGNVLKYAALAGLCASVVGATVGASALVGGGYAAPSMSGLEWLTWWLGDVVGALTVGPVLILWSREWPRWSATARTELLAVLATSIAVALVIFWEMHPVAARNAPLEFLAAPVLVWVALRFGPRETSTIMLVISAIAIWGTHNGTGPFVRTEQNESLLYLQAFMGVLCLTALAMAASAVQRQNAESLAAKERARRDAIELEQQRLEGARFMARTVAHLVNNSLTPMVGFAELLRSHPSVQGDKTLDGYTQIITQSGYMASHTISRLQDIVRLEEDTGLAGGPILDVERSTSESVTWEHQAPPG
jgi:two-component system, NarL family, sensor histidine kinase FusK